MLWVGGHIILVGTDELGLHALYGFVHHLEEPVAAIPVVGGFLGWLVNTFFSLILGAIWGSIVAGIAIGMTNLMKSKDKNDNTAQNDRERNESTVEKTPRKKNTDSSARDTSGADAE